MKIHKLKTIDPYFHDVWMGWKKFEVRVDDRDFAVDDIVLLTYFDPKNSIFTGNDKYILVKIIYILRDEKFCKKGYCVFGFDKIEQGFNYEKLNLSKYL